MAEKADNNDWIEHDGKGMPVKGTVRVNCKFRDGWKGWIEKSEMAEFFHSKTPAMSMWRHMPCSADIIAYRIVKENDNA